MTWLILHQKYLFIRKARWLQCDYVIFILFYPLGHQHYTKCDSEYRLEVHSTFTRVVLPPSVSVSIAVVRNIAGESRD